MTLNATDFQPPNEDACVVFIESAYDPTVLRGDEDEQFHQDDAARVSMRVMDMIVGLKELPDEEKEEKDKKEKAVDTTEDDNIVTTCDISGVSGDAAAAATASIKTSEAAEAANEGEDIIMKDSSENASSSSTSSSSSEIVARQTMLWIIQSLQEIDTDELFAEPVPKDTLFYFDVVSTPMDLSTIQKNINNTQSKYGGTYGLQHLYSDIQLMINNCRTYNQEGSGPYILATSLETHINSIKEEASKRWILETNKYIEEASSASTASASAASASPGTDTNLENGTNTTTTTTAATTTTTLENDDSTTMPYRELVVTKGTLMSKLVEAIREWRRPIMIKMRRPKQIRTSRRKSKKSKMSRYTPNSSKRSSSPNKNKSRRGGQKLRKIDWFLVKWSNMSFKHVSWEKSNDINDDLAIAKFHCYKSPPTQSRTDAKRTLEVKKSFRENVKMPFKWESMNMNTKQLNTDDENEIAFVLADIVRRIACKPMLADGWSLYAPKKHRTTNSWTYTNDALGLRQHIPPLGRGVFSNYKRSPDFKNGLKLRSYQVDGLNWLLRSWYAERGSILADEMGLGKTAQVISMLEHLAVTEDIRGPFLAVVPLSTIEHWRREIERWTDLKVCVYHDQEGAAGRQVIRENCWRYEDGYLSRSADVAQFNVLVTTYETLLTDLEYVGTFRWRVMITDEGHKLKNPESKIALALGEGLEVEHHLLLTGTPIQNNTLELWALMSFVQGKKKFMSYDTFTERFGKMKTSKQVSDLRKIMRPIVLRRLKRQVAKSIPAMKETVIDVELTTLQKQYYRAIFEKNREFLYRGCAGHVPQLINVEMELRKCCQHPFLLSGVEESEADRIKDAIMAGENLGTLDELMLEEAERAEKEAAEQAVSVTCIVFIILLFIYYSLLFFDGTNFIYQLFFFYFFCDFFVFIPYYLSHIRQRLV